MQYGHVIPRDTSTDDDTVTSLSVDRVDLCGAAALIDRGSSKLGRPSIYLADRTAPDPTIYDAQSSTFGSDAIVSFYRSEKFELGPR